MHEPFTKPYHDVDEWRDGPVPHRYVHGGFEGTKARFSLYFPPPDRWEGRFVQPLWRLCTGGRSSTSSGDLGTSGSPRRLVT